MPFWDYLVILPDFQRLDRDGPIKTVLLSASNICEGLSLTLLMAKISWSTSNKLASPQNQLHTQLSLSQALASTVSINEVNLRLATLVLGWVTMSGFNSWCGTFISVCNQPPRSTQPGHLFVGRCNEYQPKSNDACGWGVKAGMVRVRAQVA